MKDQVTQLIGRRISGVVIKETGNERGATGGQLFLLFDDGTCYDVCTQEGPLISTSGLVKGTLDEVLSRMGTRFKAVWMGERGMPKSMRGLPSPLARMKEEGNNRCEAAL